MDCGFAQPSAVYRHVQGLFFHRRFSERLDNDTCLKNVIHSLLSCSGTATSPLGAGLVFRTRPPEHISLRKMGCSWRLGVLYAARMATPSGLDWDPFRIFLTYRPYILRIESDFSPGGELGTSTALEFSKALPSRSWTGVPTRIFLTYRPIFLILRFRGSFPRGGRVPIFHVTRMASAVGC